MTTHDRIFLKHSIIEKGCIAILFVLVAALFYLMGEQAQIEKAIIRNRIIRNADATDSIQFIWNANEKAIPLPGNKVEIDYIDENNVYLKSIKQ